MRVSNPRRVDQKRKIHDSEAEADQKNKEPDSSPDCSPPAKERSAGLKAEATKKFLDRRYFHFQLVDSPIKTEMFYREMSLSEAYQP